MRQIVRDGIKIGFPNPCFIIAEVGVNHNGDLEMAMDMIDAIADAGADSVKFQTFKAEDFVSENAGYYEYVSQGRQVKESQFKMFKRLEIKYKDFEKLFQKARERGIVPLSTPVDKEGVDLLSSLGVRAFKVGSDDLVYSPLIEYISKKNKPMIISAGMASEEDIDRAVNLILSQGNTDICILHCRSIYPTPPDKLNLRQISSLADKYNFPIGFSDHSEGIVAALGAVALGSAVIEKHFTLDKSLPGPDHHFSMDFDELKMLVAQIRNLEAGLGDGIIGPTQAELEMRITARRSIVAKENFVIGDIITEEKLSYRRPGSGLMPYELNKIKGKKINKNVLEGEQITLDSIDE